MADQINTIEELIPFDGWTATLDDQHHRYGADSAFSVPVVEEISVTFAALVKTRISGPRMLMPPPPPPPGSIPRSPTSRSRSPPKRMQVPPPLPPMAMPDRSRSPTKRMNIPPPPPPMAMPDRSRSATKRMNEPPPLPLMGRPQSPNKRMNVPPPPPPPSRMLDRPQSPTKRMNVPPPPPPMERSRSPTKRMNVPSPPPPMGIPDRPRSPPKRMNVPPPPPPDHETITKLAQLADDVEDVLDRSIQEATRVYRREDFATPDNGVWIDDVKFSRQWRSDKRYHSFDLGPFPSPEYNARRQMNFSDCPSSVLDEESSNEESVNEKSVNEESVNEESVEEDENCFVPIWMKWAPPNLWKRHKRRMELRRRKRQIAPEDN